MTISSIPAASPQLDCNGLLFGNHGLYEANLRKYTNFPPFCPNNANYEYKDSNGSGYPEDNWGTSFTLNMSSMPNPGGGQTFPAKYVFDVCHGSQLHQRLRGHRRPRNSQPGRPGQHCRVQQSLHKS